MLPLIFVLSVGITGCSIFFALNRKYENISLSLANVFEIFLVGILSVSIICILLLELSRFNIKNAVLFSSAFALIFGLSLSSLPKISFEFKLSRFSFALLLILSVASFFRLPPWNWIVGGQDQGLYTNIGSHFRNTGKIAVADRIIQDLPAKDHLLQYYLKNNYQDVWGEGVSAMTNRYEGDYTPGLYLKNLRNGIMIPQFYHLHPTWLAIANYLFGEAHSSYLLYIFGILSIFLIYLITKLLFNDPIPALFAASLLAFNPVHTYMSKFPVSEVTAGLFFLSGFYFTLKLCDSTYFDPFYSFASVLSFGCFFFTRITGFLFLPLIFSFLILTIIYSDIHKKYKSFIWTSAGILLVYIYSLVHGCLFSFPYSRFIYHKYLGIKLDNLTDHRYIITAIFLVFLIFFLIWLSRKYSFYIRSLILQASHKRSQVIFGIFMIVFSLAVYRGYLYAFTDHFLDPKFSDPGTGFQTIPRLNISVLAIILTPWGLLLSFYGLYDILKNGFDNSKKLILGISCFYFLFIYIVIKIITPYLYYWSRYLLSELIPLLIISLSFCLYIIFKKYVRIGILILILIIFPSVLLSFFHSRDIEMKNAYHNLKEMNSFFDRNSVLFIDSMIKPSSALLKPPLKLTFDRDIFFFNADDLETPIFKDILSFFISSGRNLFLLSNNGNLDNKYFIFDRNISVHVNSLSRTYKIFPMAFEEAKPSIISIYKQSEAIRELIKTCRELNELTALGFKANLKFDDLTKIVFSRNKLHQIPVIIQNIGTDKWSHLGDCSVNLSYHWLTDKNEMLLFDGIRTPLPRDLYPGETEMVSASIKTPDYSGKYFLEIDLVQENVSWFKNKGSKILRIAVDVK